MVSYRELVAARPELLDQAADGWEGIRVRFGEQTYAYTVDVHDRVHDGVSWTGAAAETARQRMSTTGRQLLATGEYLAAQSSLLREAATGIRDCQRQLADAQATAHAHGVGVDGTGRVVVPPAVNEHNAALNQAAAAEHQQRQRVAAEVNRRIDNAVAQATAWDAAIAARLRMPDLFDAVAEGGDWWSPAHRVAVADAGALADFAAGRIPPLGSDPRTVHEFWEQSSVSERNRLIREHPELIGALDGIPSLDRDAANRIRLAGEIRSTENELAQLKEPPRGYAYARAGGSDPAWAEWRAKQDALDDRLNGLRAIHDRLFDPHHTNLADPQHALLLGLDTTGTGRAIVAVGNPDTAEHVVTYVPGTGAHLGNIGGDIERSDRMQAQADKLVRNGNTAAVTWVGYTAPQSLGEAPSQQYARDAEPLLQRFESGLRVTHEGTPAHQTIIGHSYGSTTVGYAMRDGGLPVDDVIFVGSPGVGVEHASDLGIDPSHVFAGTSAHDPIQYGTSLDPGRIVQDLPYQRSERAGPVTVQDSHLWFGRDPAHQFFGANTLPTDPGRSLLDGGSHSQYWDPGSRSLRSIAEVVVGKMPSGSY